MRLLLDAGADASQPLTHGVGTAVAAAISPASEAVRTPTERHALVGYVEVLVRRKRHRKYKPGCVDYYPTGLAHPEAVPRSAPKTKVRKTFRKKTPAQNAAFLQYLATTDTEISEPINDCQSEIDQFYANALGLLNKYYPECTITITSRDPEYITPDIKAKLRRKNRLMRAGRIEEADALAERIGADITKQNSTRLRHINPKTSSRDMWAAVRQVTGKRQNGHVTVDGISATSLNLHYAAISTDTDYQSPSPKQTSTIYPNTEYLSEWEVFRQLDTLHSTATGLDELPAWFIKLAAPVFCKPITRLFNCSITTSTVPSQWKAAYISPVPKVSTPLSHSDYRPISITPILSRIIEKLVVRHFLYPTFSAPPSTLTFSDQFAFRPTGSTTAALIYIFHTVIQLLTNYQYVTVIALDFSKAFDTVRHNTLLEKMADLAMPDEVYNWLVSYFSGHKNVDSHLSFCVPMCQQN